MLRIVLALLLCQTAAPRTSADLWQAGLRDEAIERASADLARTPGDAALRRRLAEWEVAVHRYQAAIERLGPPTATPDPLRGLALYRAGELAAALAHLDAREPDQALMRIDALEALGRFAESDAELAGARARLKNDARLAACEGRRLARERRFADAAAAFRAALARDPFDGEALFGLGRALVQGGEREEGLQALARHRELVPLLDAVDFARRGVDLAPAHAPNWSALGDAERALGRLDRAEEAYRRAAELAREPEHVVANALRHARLLDEDQKDLEGALRVLDDAAKRADDVRLHVRAGDLLWASGDRRALAAFERALALRPDDVGLWKRIEAVRGSREPR